MSYLRCLCLFVGGFMSYLRCLCLFGPSLPPVVCRIAHDLFTLFVFVWSVFTSSCRTAHVLFTLFVFVS
jgi:hypothetical protein